MNKEAGNLPLSGLKVLELGVIVSGPTAGLIFSDLGAEVIKVENTVFGDPNRENTGAPGTGQFDFLNRGKKSVSLDLKTETGRRIYLELARNADVVVENLAPGVADSLGVSYRNLVRVNPGIMYCSIKGFGKGRFSNRKMTDYPAQAESGLAYMTGLENRPMRAGASVLDMMAATMCVIAVLSKLYRRLKLSNSEGEEITVGMFETGAFLVGPIMSRYMIKKEIPLPLNVTDFRWAIYDFFDMKGGGKVFIGVINEKQWKSFCAAFHLDGIEGDIRFRTNTDRLANKKALIKIVQEEIMKREPQELFEMLERTDVLYARLNRPDELLSHPHLLGKLLSYESIYDDGINLKLPRLPIDGNSFDCIAGRRAPALGENTVEVLAELGYTRGEISKMRNEKSIYYQE